MRRTALGTATALVIAGQALAQTVGGSYAVQGSNLDGTPYQGTAQITLASDTTCTIEWTTGTTSSVGICMYVGSAFAAAYVQGEGAGLTLYEIEESGTLNGVWTVTGQSGAGTEVLTPQ